MNRSSSRWIVASAWLPFAALGWLLWGLDRSVPLFDEWPLFEFAYQSWSGETQFSDWFAPHNSSHVLLVPRIVMTAIALATHGSPRAQLMFNFGIVLLAFVLVRRLQARGPAAGTRAGDWAQLGTALIFCSPVAFSAQAWTPAFCHFAVNLGMISAALALAPGPGRARTGLALAATACTLTTFTRSEGLATWLLLLPNVWLLVKDDPLRRRWLVAWLCGAAACAAVIAASMAWLRPEGASPLPYSLFSDLPLAAGVALGLVAMPFASPLHLVSVLDWPEPRAFMPIGLLVVGVFATLSWRLLRSSERSLREHAWAWVSIGCFGLLFAFVSARVRLNPLETNVFGDFWPANFSITASLVGIATAQLMALEVTRLHAAGAPRRATLQLAALGTIGLLLLAGGVATRGPAALWERTRSQTHATCWELFDQIAPWSTCFLARPAEAAAARWEEIGFRDRRHDVVKHPRPRAELGAIEGQAPGQHGGLPHTLNGWVVIDDAAPRASVWLEASTWSGLVAPARVTHVDGARAQWVAEMTLLQPGTRVVAWRYDAATGRLERLAGEVTIAPQ